jgi:hypothetical protein
MEKAPPPEEPSRSLQNQPTSLSSQRARLLAYMRARGSINAFEAISKLNILRPGARIAELRAAGHNIRTQLGELPDNQGLPHPLVATYYLSGEPINTNEVAA